MVVYIHENIDDLVSIRSLAWGQTRLLEAQEYACGMCRTPFDDDQPIFIDHACCPAERTCCGTCVRGLLCLSCNTALGHIERKYELARAYLDSPRASSSCGANWPPEPIEDHFGLPGAG